MKAKTKSGGLGSLLFNLLVGAFVALALGAPPALGGSIGVGLGFVPRPSMDSALMAGLNKEIWINRIMENFYPKADWLGRVTDMSMWVEFNTINLAEAGVDPAVLINNTVYPVATAQRTDNPLALPLETYDSENTLVRNIEEIETAYDKMGSVTAQHQNAIRKKQFQRAAFSYAPASNAVNTPVLAATGAVDAVTGVTKVISEDIAKMQRRFNDMDFPEDNRIAVLSARHAEELFNDNKQLNNQYVNLKEGQVLRYCGFDFYIFSSNPLYNKTTQAKKAWGAAAAGTDTVSSVFFCGSEVMKADGTWDMFSKLKDPEQRGDIVGFQKRFLALPIRAKAIGSIIGV